MIALNTKRCIGLFLTLISLLFISGCSGGSNSSDRPTDIPPDISVVRLQITPAVSYLPVDLHKSLKAEAILEDGRVLDVTADPAVQWSSSDPDVATVDQGIVTGLAVGTVNITASGEANGQSFSEKVEVIITNRIVTDLQITPKEYALPIGLQTNLKAKATLDDDSVLDVTTDTTVQWSSSAPGVASVDQGTVTGLAVGNATITASGVANGKAFSDSAVVTITSAVVKELQINSHAPTLAAGLHKDLKAQVRLSDGRVLDITGNEALNWKSSDDKIATISNIGRVTAKSAGTVEFTASGVANNTPFSDETSLEITAAFVRSLAILDEDGAPIVEPNNLPAGLHQQLLAQATLSNNTLENVTTEDDLHWNSLNPEVAIIDQNGRVTAHEPGQATITASYIIEGRDPVAAPAVVVKVTNAVVKKLVINAADGTELPLRLPAGLHQNLQAQATLSDGDVRNVTDEDALFWVSEPPEVATIDDNGRVTAGRLPGEATITATYIYGDRAPVGTSTEVTITDAVVKALRITPPRFLLSIDGNQGLNAIATLSNDSERVVTTEELVSWESNNRGVATISSIGSDKGTATGRANGSARITARIDDDADDIYAVASVTVSDSLLDYFTDPTNKLMNWSEADEFCKASDARLPTVAELQNLFIQSTSATAIGSMVENYEMCNLHGWPLFAESCEGTYGAYWTGEPKDPLVSGVHSLVYMSSGTKIPGIETGDEAIIGLAVCVETGF
ncbi:Ig-like domain-containing protein [Aeromonas sp. 1HA1]|uniref:Ig-like domain-containing protein n=1 Tax=Aeromonas sp. 1HA1 TaxID=2699193 RepID=UPI0023DDA5B2|nr:Ig-like domain-containing protein [Aeromonas sp. 1HA1]MDF2412590.1 hypothetical protein [Aeromonas sp. 1HA1]